MEMSFDFDTPVERRGSGSYKWDEPLADGAPGDYIPLWVADMDFPTAPAVRWAVEQRAAAGIFGYTYVDESYYRAVISWFSRRHGWTIDRADILYTSGVVPALSCTVKALTMPGEQVLVLSPVYNCFFSSIRNNGCQVVECPLVYEDASYHVDWEAFEACCAQEKTTLLLLCNPHNPAGRVWTVEELRRMGEICLKYDVFVIADEIHCELVMPGHHYTPFASLSPEFLRNSATCVAPTKAFNIAGLQIANIIVKDAQKRERIDRGINMHEVCDVNPFGVIASEAAYTDEGAEWLRQLNEYIAKNYDYLCQFISGQLPQLRVVKLEGTYLAWVDCSALSVSSSVLVERLLTKYGVWLNDAEMYGEKERPFVRINLACPRATLAEGLRRMAEGIAAL